MDEKIPGREYVAIVGSRYYQHLGEVRQYVESLAAIAGPNVVIVSGGAAGVDTRAELVARERGLECVVLRPTARERELHGPRGCFLARNRRIIALADRIVAFHDGTSRGTAYVIREARRVGKPVKIFY